MLDGGGRVVAERDSGTRYYPASTIKLAVLLAVMRDIDAGLRSLDDTVVVRRTFTSAQPGADPFTLETDDADERFPDDGTAMQLRDVLDRMIYRSSNEATNLALELIGLDAVNDTITDAGLVSTKMKRLIGDIAARDGGLTNQTTASDLARLMRVIVSGMLTSAGSTRFMITALEHQDFAYIAPGLPAGVRWGSKSGWVEGITHDVAFIGTPGTAATLYLAVCTRGYDERQGIEAVGAMAAGITTPLLIAAPEDFDA
nr:serine hydrolase [Spelaeicoccus albus]